MTRWTVGKVSVEPLEAEDAGFFGLNQTRSSAAEEKASGAFYAEVWSQDRTTRLVHDLDRGLPPAGSYEPHLVQAAEMPSGAAMLNCFYSLPGQDERLGEQWEEVQMPEAGWAGQMICITWIPGE